MCVGTDWGKKSHDLLFPMILLSLHLISKLAECSTPWSQPSFWQYTYCTLSITKVLHQHLCPLLYFVLIVYIIVISVRKCRRQKPPSDATQWRQESYSDIAPRKESMAISASPSVPPTGALWRFCCCGVTSGGFDANRSTHSMYKHWENTNCCK